MTYSIIGVLASILLLIINRDVFWNKKDQPLTKTMHTYRLFLIGVLTYLVTDFL